MARRCACAKILDQLRMDPRLRALPLATRAVWVEVLAALAAFAPTGAISFLHPVPVSVARWLGIAESEAETELGNLVAAGLLVVDEGGKRLASPELQQAADRSAINRANGLKGGRPKKYAIAGQREIMLPIDGGKSKVTEPETEPGSPSDMLDREREKIDHGEVDWVSLGHEVGAPIGLDPARGFVDCRPVQAWLAEGLTPERIRSVAAEVAGRAKRPISHLSYFTPAMRQAAAEARPQSAPPVHVAAYSARWQAWIAGGRIGSPPVMDAAA